MAWIELEGAVNVRDLGGLPTEDGGQTVAARLLRADNLQDLSPSDVTRLVKDLGVTNVVDLRSSHELTAGGPGPLDGVPGIRHTHHPIVSEVGAPTDVVAAALAARAEEDRVRYPPDPVCGHYLGYLEARPDDVISAVRAIARSEGAALVHCAAGKDRTGVVVALALTAVGVSSDAVVADYAASGERAEAIVDRLRRSAAYARDVNSKPVSSYQVHAPTMAAFLTEMDSRFGGVTSWLAGHGLSQEELRLLRVKLLDGAGASNQHGSPT